MKPVAGHAQNNSGPCTLCWETKVCAHVPAIITILIFKEISMAFPGLIENPLIAALLTGDGSFCKSFIVDVHVFSPVKQR